MEARGEARTKDGPSYDNLYGIVLRSQDGKVSEIRGYMDASLTKAICG